MSVVKKAAISVGFIVFCSGILLCNTFAADPIKVGVLLPLSGRNAAIGQIQKNAVLMAAAEINARGRIKDRKMDLVLADTKGTPDGGRAAIRKLIQTDNVLVIGGGFSSSATWATGAIAQQDRVPFVVTGAMADKITEQDWEYVFRLNQPLGEHLEALATFISTTAADLRSVAILHTASLRSSAAARRFFKKSASLNLELVIRERFETNDNLSEMLARVRFKNPDLIYVITDDVKNAALLVRQSRALKMSPKLFVGEGTGFDQTEFISQAGKASNHIVSTTLWTPLVPHPGAAAFNQKFTDRYRTPPGPYGAQAYAGMMVIAEALRRARELTPAAVRDALSLTDISTLLGPIKFVAYDKKSQQNRLPTYLVQWIGGKQEIIWPKEFATHKPIFPAPPSSEDRGQMSDDR
ncbi:MAG: ABC transporter substrate-binding protein [Desulfobacterales bacterium]|jgi:branched-chain amino acid transport system substrate-binding protein